MLSILSKTVSTLSEKKGPDSLQAIESVGSGVMKNIGKYVVLLKSFFGSSCGGSVKKGRSTNCSKKMNN